MDWLIENIFYVSTAAFVLGVALLGSYMAMHTQSRGMSFFSSRPRRLGVVEQTSIDSRRKLLLVRRDNVEHLVLIGGPIDVILETGIPRATFHIEPVATREPLAQHYTNGHSEPMPLPEQPPSFLSADAYEREQSRSVTAFPFRGAAKRLFSKMSIPAVGPSSSDSGGQAARESDTNVMVELGDERQAEKVT